LEWGSERVHWFKRLNGLGLPKHCRDIVIVSSADRKIITWVINVSGTLILGWLVGKVKSVKKKKKRKLLS